MAYLRWSFSDWYVFWHASKSKKIDEQLLAIWHALDVFKNNELKTFTYKQLKNVNSVDDLKELLKLDLPDRDYEELLIAVKDWKDDIEKAYAKGELE